MLELLLVVVAINVLLLGLQLASMLWLGRRGKQIYTPRDLRTILSAVPRGEKDWEFAKVDKARSVVVNDELWVDARSPR